MSETPQRKAWMSLLAKASADDVARVWADFGSEPAYEVLRAPEVGAVMVRGRAGATGAPFNLGEMTVTRCTLRLEQGSVGHAYVQGRNKTHAKTAAIIDALMQTKAAGEVQRTVLDPLETACSTAKSQRQAKAAATKVEFFTMVRGED